MAKHTDNGQQRRVRQIVRAHGSPVLAVSRAALKAQLARFRRHLPRVQPYYAIKAQPCLLNTQGGPRRDEVRAAAGRAG